VYKRKLIGFCCAIAAVSMTLASTGASAQAPFRTRGTAGNAPAKAAFDATRPPAASSNPSQAFNSVQISLPNSAYLVREVVYNELHDHDNHGYWRYWIEHHSSKETQLQEAVETSEGPIARLQLSNGRPISGDVREDEDRRLQRLLSSPSEQAQHRKEYAEDEHRIGRILTLLPEAFLYEPAQSEARTERLPDCPCYHLRFHPNPSYPAHSIESRIFHAMVGDLWISSDHKRLVRLDGRLQDNVDFGYGIFGRLYKDGWFRLERTKVDAGNGNGDWKTRRLEVHMNGRAMLFKTIARETSEVRGGFTPVPSGLSLQQAAILVREPMDATAPQAASLATSR
jgi:hypothetical protein